MFSDFILIHEPLLYIALLNSRWFFEIYLAIRIKSVDAVIQIEQV